MIDKYELFGQGHRLLCPHCKAPSVTVDIKRHPTGDIYSIRLYCYGCLVFVMTEISAYLLLHEQDGKAAMERILMDLMYEFEFGRYKAQKPQKIILSPDDSIDKYWAEVSATD